MNLISFKILFVYYRVKISFLTSFILYIITWILINKINVFNLNRLISLSIYFL